MGATSLNIMRRLFPLAICMLVLFLETEAQITSYPYIEDFEDFTTIQTTGSCVAPAGMNVGGWTQQTNDDGDWRSDTAGTGSVGTGPGSGINTSGNGLGFDVNPGTLGGHYLYTEATGCFNTEVVIVSPTFDFSSPSTYYTLSFAFHMFGDDIGSLHIDVGDSGVWTNDVWVQIGQLDSNWQFAEVSLANYHSDSIQLRFRGITGSSFRSDICLDDIRVESFTPPSYDAIITEFENSANEYPIRPLSQYDSVSFDIKVKNEGIKDATATTVEITQGAYTSTTFLGDLASFEEKQGTSSPSYWPDSVGTINFRAVVSIAENDSFPANDTMYNSIIVSDSVYARENSNSVAGIGFNTTPGMLGQLFELIRPDTITSFTFKAQGEAGDSAKVHIYSYDTAVGALIISTELIILTGNEQWYTVGLACPEVLDSGTYLVSLEQVSASNIGLSMDNSGYRPNSAFFKADGVAEWTAVEVGGFEVCYLLRMNFGHVDVPTATLSTVLDTVCEGAPFSAIATGNGSYNWMPNASFTTPTFPQTIGHLQHSGEIQVVVKNSCGFTDTARKYMVVEKGPTARTSPDTTVCKGDEALLKVITTNLYQWENGPSNTDFKTVIDSTHVFSVKIDSSNGCSKRLNINVTSSEPEVFAFGDTTVCAGEFVDFYATGARSYQWQGGPGDSSYKHKASSSGHIIVFGYNQDGCEAKDSVDLEVLKSPSFDLPSDTGACFTDSIYLIATGADSLYWQDESSDSILRLRVTKNADYIAVGVNLNGCVGRDTVSVEAFIPPFATISEDTTICEGESAQISASGGDLYEWNTGETTSTISVTPTSSKHFKVIVRSLNGCSDEDSVYIEIDPLPVVSFSYMTYVDSVQFTDESLFGDHYHWNFGDGDSSLSLNPFHLYDTSGTYPVVLTVKNHCGTKDTTINVDIDIPIGSVHAGIKAEALQLYPNPVNQSATLLLDNKWLGLGQLSIYSSSGQMVQHFEFEKQLKRMSIELDLTSLPSGSYWIDVQLANSKKGIPFIKLD